MRKHFGITPFGLFLAVLVGLMAALLLLAASNYGAYAEATPSPTVESLYRVESDAMRISEAPVRLTIIDLVTVDIDGRKLAEAGQIEAKVYFPWIPDEDVEGLVLFDGYHLAHSQWMRIENNALIVTFTAESIKDFDGTVGLYLILIGHAE